MLELNHRPMRAGSSPPRVFALLLTGMLVACSSASTKLSAGSDPDDSDRGDTNSGIELAFSPDSRLTLYPGQEIPLLVTIAPASGQTVTFDILTEDENFDGFLKSSTATADSSGHAEVILQAPSAPTEFVVRASLEQGAQSRREISVSLQGYTELRVSPSYQGTRGIGEWTASAWLDTTCGDLESFFVDGEFSATGRVSVDFGLVPIDTPISVSLRGDHLVSGCIDLQGLGSDSDEPIIVDVSDRALDLQSGVLRLELGVDSTSTAFIEHQSTVISQASEAFLNGGINDAEALLLRMSGELPTASLSAFQEASATYDFSAALRQLYGEEAVLSTALRSLLSDGAAGISGAEVFVGELELDAQDSTFTLVSAGAVSAAQAGFTLTSPWEVTAESTEAITFGGPMEYLPLGWLGALADQEAESDGGSAAQLFVNSGRCGEVASTLLTANSSLQIGSCGSECLEMACQSALASFWNKELRETGEPVSINVSSTGEVGVWGEALIDEVNGSWLGAFEGDMASIGGAVAGTRR